MKTRQLAAAAVTAAAYAAITMIFAPISYGPIQCRLSEVLCILPALIPGTSWGLFAGCAVANLLSPIGPVDVILGSSATLMAALSAEALAKKFQFPPNLLRAAAVCAMPVIWNAAIIGAMIAVSVSSAETFWTSFLIFAAQVGAGEAAVMYVIGLPLLIALPKSQTFMSLKNKIEDGEQ